MLKWNVLVWFHCHEFTLYLTGLLVSDTLSESRHANRRSSITPDFSSPRNSWGDIWWLLLRLPWTKYKENITCKIVYVTLNIRFILKKRNNIDYYCKIGFDHEVTTITRIDKGCIGLQQNISHDSTNKKTTWVQQA